MKLTIKNPEDLYLDEFITDFLFPMIQDIVDKSYNPLKASVVENYINELYKDNSAQYIYVKDILNQAIDNLIYIRTPSCDYEIQVDSTKNVYNIRAKIIDLVNMINYGTLSTPAYPILSDALTFIKENIVDIYRQYQRQ